MTARIPIISTVRRKLLPSKSLALYVMRVYLSRFILVLLILSSILQSLDLLNRSDDIVAGGGGSDAMLQYIQWRLPELISQFTPFAALLAALFSYFTLAQSSEITIMRASGMAPGQVTAPLLAASLVIAGVHLLFHDTVTVPSSAKLKYWQDQDYSMTGGEPVEGRSDIWVSDGRQIISAKTANRVADQIILDTVIIYRRDENGLVIQSLAAEFAVKNTQGWSLYNVRRFDLNAAQMTVTETLPFSIDLPDDQIFARVERPNHVPFGRLGHAIETLEQAGAETFTLRTSFHHRIAQAFSSVMMPLIALFVGFSLPRGGGRAGRVVLGMAFGFSYFIADNYMTAMGSMGVVPPLMAAYSSLVLFFLFGLNAMMRLD